MKHPVRDRKARRLLETGKPYQGDRLSRALPFCRQRRLALDVGAHIGLWAVQLAECFEHVVAFEPNNASFDALVENVAGKGVTVWHCALGEDTRTAWLIQMGLAAHIAAPDEPTVDAIEVEVTSLDAIEFPPIDFIKLDVEGFETAVLHGGEQTIRRDRPVIVLEQKHEHRYGLETNAAVKLLQRWGASVEWRKKNDYCLRWR
jgi:FkbM family methyltransferase